MKLSNSDIEHLCQLALKAAQKAGKIIHESINSKVTVATKDGADSLASQVVTEVDVKAQDAILKVLAPTFERYDLALLTEESTDDKSRFEKDYFWCIDPMDGTLAFTQQKPGFAVSIALVAKNGEPQLGVVFDPSSHTFYHAIKGKGAYKNGQVWHIEASSSTFTFHVDQAFAQSEQFSSIAERIKSVAQEAGFPDFKIQKYAGAVLNAIWTIDRAPGCYFKIPKPQKGGGSIWDFAASACIANEAGTYGRSFDDSAFDLNRKDSTFMNHRGAFFASDETLAKMIQNKASLIS